MNKKIIYPSIVIAAFLWAFNGIAFLRDAPLTSFMPLAFLPIILVPFGILHALQNKHLVWSFVGILIFLFSLYIAFDAAFKTPAFNFIRL